MSQNAINNAPHDDSFRIVDGNNVTRKLAFDVGDNSNDITGTIKTIFSTAKVVTIPNATDTLVGKATIDSLTNKTVDDVSNVVRASKLATTGAPVVISTSAPPAIGDVLKALSATSASWVAAGSTATPYVDTTGTTQALAVNTNYGANNGSQVVFTLPATAAVGDEILVTGVGVGGWKIAQNASQIIHINRRSTTSGVSGYLESTRRRDTVTLMCVVANTDFNAVSSMGNVRVV